MAGQTLLDRTYGFVLNRFIETGRAPHYTEVAAGLGLSVEEGRKAVRELICPRVAGWFFPDTDLIVSLAPFSSLPNQYRITIDGRQDWFGQ